jgi:hypothetical protein
MPGVGGALELDRGVRREDIQVLSSRDQVAALFAALGYQVTQLRPLLTKIRQLEIELQHLVFDLYGLTPDEVQLLRSTAPPRDPLALVEAAALPSEDAWGLRP